MGDCSLQLDNLEFDGEEINGLARCPFDSKQTNVALFAGKCQTFTRPRLDGPNEEEEGKKINKCVPTYALIITSVSLPQ